MFSLNPRYNLFRFCIPKELIPEEIREKWTNILNEHYKQPIRNPIDIINESISGVSIPSIGESVVKQAQTGKNILTHRTEPISEVPYRSTQSPWELIEPTITVTFRHIQGFYNYLLLYESWFYHHAKDSKEKMPDLYLEFMNDEGEVMMFMQLMDPIFVGLDGVEVSYDRVERGTDNFTVTFSGRAIDFDFGKH